MLYPFQQTGAEWLAGANRAYLADDCGTGKTIQACHAVKLIDVQSVLVLCPASAVENWKREWELWGPGGLSLDVASYAHPALQSTARAIKNKQPVPRRDYDLVISDEAHMLKTKDSLRSLAAYKLLRDAPRKWLLSATPMPNHLGELWTPLRALWPEIPKAFNLNSHWQWMNHFCKYTLTEHGPYVYGSKHARQLAPYLKKMMLRRTLDEIGIEMPPLRVDVSLLPRDDAFRAALQLEGIHTPDDYEQAMDEEEHSARLRHMVGDYKAPRVAEIIADELRSQQYSKIVVFYHHKSVGEVLRRKLAEFGVIGFDGSTSKKARQFAVDVFSDTTKELRVFLVQQMAGGIAINLQVASEAVLVEPARTPEDDYQAIKRIHRIGSTRPCRARIFAVANSYDETIMRGQANKIQMQIDVGLGRDKKGIEVIK
jgi:SWI/SNF-related matrix-associated actin-dependent regulator 1 of chromatin subfamily A